MALTTEDMELSARILSMLAGSGDQAVIFLAERLGVRQAFACMFDVLPLEKEDLLDFVGSDGHGIKERTPEMGKAYDQVVKVMGESYARRIFVTNPGRIVAGGSER